MSNVIKELASVVLTENREKSRLKTGDVGTVVAVYGDGAGYEVEFMTLDGRTVDVLSLPASALRPVGPDEIANARAVA